MGMIQVLEQTEMWYGEDGFPYKITEMETRHLENVIRFLARQSKNLFARKLYTATGGVRDIVGVELQLDGDNPAMMQQMADEWLKSRPLLRAMAAELLKRKLPEATVIPLSGSEMRVIIE
jgi:hypothetical protein